MRCFAGTLTALALTILIATPALGQIDIDAPVNIENIPRPEDLQNIQIENGQHLLTIQVPFYARDLHDDVETVEVQCYVFADQDTWTGYGVESRPYRGRTIDTTLSVPIEFDEGEEGYAASSNQFYCRPIFLFADGSRQEPSFDATDPRALLDESSSRFTAGPLN